MIDSSQALLWAILAFFVYNLQKRRRNVGTKVQAGDDDKNPQINAVDLLFDWKTESPRPHRPFKAGTFYMTMGIKKIDVNDWILLENTYKSVTAEKKRVIADKRPHCVLYTAEAEEPIRELYDTIAGFLVERYPQYFKTKNKNVIENTINGTTFPRFSADVADSRELIEALSSNIEEDFLLLTAGEDGQYYLRGGSFAFPSGFDPALKLGLPLSGIHEPVPYYAEKIQSSMDRYFTKMKPGQWIERFNWGVQCHNNLYAASENHASVEDDEDEEVLEAENLDFEKVFLRVERQVLTRLPKSNAIVFTIRTYLTPLSQIREEGKGDTLVSAIENLPTAMAHYKKSDVWGRAVKEYMQYRSNGVAS